jgi:glycosyltransferase involved in cell wall biosynthesis
MNKENYQNKEKFLITKQSIKIAILMATYNGEKYIKEQLDSIEQQDYKNWILWISDDGSNDKTLTIIKEYEKKWDIGKLNIITDKHKGSALNFLTLTSRIDIIADYFAWADQDDIWLPDKLSRAIKKLSNIDPQKPILYCSRTILCDSLGIVNGLSPKLNIKPFKFSNSLIQCISGGNTMVFNNTARLLIINIKEKNIVSHDWWAYQIITANDGEIIYDKEPKIKYRQHKNNLVGSNRGIKGRIKRLKRILSGDYKRILERQLKALNSISEGIPNHNREKLQSLITILYNEPNSFKKLYYFIKYNYYRQTIAEQIFLYLCIFFKIL